MGSNQKFDVAVIGAGIAGLWTCKKLRSAGFKVALIDKSRGLGGRMATRRAGTLQFDHGAQFFTASKPAFLGLVSDQLPRIYALNGLVIDTWQLPG